MLLTAQVLNERLTRHTLPAAGLPLNYRRGNP